MSAFENPNSKPTPLRFDDRPLRLTTRQDDDPIISAPGHHVLRGSRVLEASQAVCRSVADEFVGVWPGGKQAVLRLVACRNFKLKPD